MSKGRKRKDKKRQEAQAGRSGESEVSRGASLSAASAAVTSSPGGSADSGDVAKRTGPAGSDRKKNIWRDRLTHIGLCASTIILLTASFAPFDLWMLAFFALVPWCLSLVGLGRGRAALSGLIIGLIYWGINVYWLSWTTLMGYFPTVIYLSLYWLFGSMLMNSALRRNWPIWIVLPVIWVGLEFARSYIISGFPWFYLAHTQYTQLELIQISDVTGQYGVSFFVAMVNGFVVDIVLAGRRIRAGLPAQPRRLTMGTAAVAASLIVMIGYGQFRLSEKTTQDGPVIGIVQQAVPISLSGKSESSRQVLQKHLDAARQLAGTDCQVVLTPETMAPSAINREFIDYIRNSKFLDYVEKLIEKAEKEGSAVELVNLIKERDDIKEQLEAVERIGEVSRELGCPILIGAITYNLNPVTTDKNEPFLFRNSVLWFDQSDRDSAVYSKVQLVPFSEYVPFKAEWPAFHVLLRKFVPPVMSQLDPGRDFSAFKIRKGKQDWSMATPICFEGTFDRICRKMVYGDDGVKKVSILANISNDGWFYWQWAGHASTENALHMSHYVFRAIENRVPVVRAVNTGISCSINSNGQILAMVGQKADELRYRGTPMAVGNLLLDGKPDAGKQTGGVAVTRGPVVQTDSRESLYGRIADIFAWIISMVAAGLTGIMVFIRPKESA